MQSKGLFLAYFSFFLIVNTFAFSGNNTQISLLTVLPRSNFIYTIYGHTAIRMCNSSEDWVFNYGSFDSSRPNFTYHFVRGETDYYLDVCSYDEFEFKYRMGNYTVIEQVLNLPYEEKDKMIRMLFFNFLPENRGYRYDFLFDNCTTRPRDIIEKFAGGRIVYKEQKKPVTFRELIHSCSEPYPWMTVGIDLLIGNGADSLIGLRQEMFLPEKLMNALETAYVVNDSLEQRHLVSSTQVVIQSSEADNNTESSLFSPMKTGIVLLIHALAFGICGIIFKRKFRFFFGLIYLQATLIGLLVWFVALFSIHPCTFPNLNMYFFHPFYVIAVLGYVLPKAYRFVTWFHWINFTFLPVFLMAWPFILQNLNNANIPYILCLWVGSGVWLKLGIKT